MEPALARERNGPQKQAMLAPTPVGPVLEAASKASVCQIGEPAPLRAAEPLSREGVGERLENGGAWASLAAVMERAFELERPRV